MQPKYMMSAMSQMKTCWDRLIPFGKVAVEILRYSYDLDMGMVEYLRFCLAGRSLLALRLHLEIHPAPLFDTSVQKVSCPGLDIYFFFIFQRKKMPKNVF